DKNVPMPVLAYAASPSEMRVIFDRPIPAESFKDLTKQTSIKTGKYVVAGERFESFRPGYQAVKHQRATPSSKLAVESATIAADRRSMTLKTAPTKEALKFAVTLPGFDAAKPEAIDLLADLTGVEAKWTAASGHGSWSGWLPHLDLAVARGFTAV